MKKRQLTTKGGSSAASTKKPPTERIIKDIRSLREQNKPDSEIREMLGIELRTYQRYTKTIYEEDKQVWYDIASQELESELLKLRTCLNNNYNIAVKIAEDDNSKVDERLQACQAAADFRISQVQILREYPIFVKVSTEINEEKESTLPRIH